MIICGLEGVGFATLEQLHLSGLPVTVVDDDPDARLKRVAESWGVPVVTTSARIGDGLSEAGIDTAQAVICTEETELKSLEIALKVRSLRPDIQLVVQIANRSVGDALQKALGRGQVLDVASLAAPSFVEACLGTPVHRIHMGGTEFSVVELTVGEDRDSHQQRSHPESTIPTTFRDRYGSLVPIAVMPQEPGPVQTAATGDQPDSKENGRLSKAGNPIPSEMAICPGRDHPIKYGDKVALLGATDELGRAGIQPKAPHSHNQLGSSVAAKIRHRLNTIKEMRILGLLLSASGLIAMMLLAMLVIHFGYRVGSRHGHLDLLRSLYFAVETISTVGFGDYSYASQNQWMVGFAIALIIIGISLVTLSFALFTNFLVSRRIEQSFGRLRVTGLSGHVIVIGLGSVGIGVVEGLVSAGKKVVVVEKDDSNRYLGRARALGVSIIIADATQKQTHFAANLDGASAVAILTSNDLTNIETGLAIRQSLGDRCEEVPTVLRVFDPNLAGMMESGFGFRHVRSTAALAAPWFVGAALGLGVLETFYVEQQPFLVAKLKIAAGGGLQGLSMQDLSARTRVIALERSDGVGGLEYPPRRGTRFDRGDTAYILGPYEEIIGVLRRDQMSVGAKFPAN